MRARLVVFHLPEGSAPADHRRFRRAVYGEESTSWQGKYRHHRAGFLDGVPHVRLYWGVVLVREADWGPFRKVLADHGAVTAWREVTPTAGDLRALETPTT